MTSTTGFDTDGFGFAVFGLFAVEVAGFEVAVGFGLAVFVCVADGLLTGEFTEEGGLGEEGTGTGLAKPLPGFCGVRGGEDEVDLEPFLITFGFSGEDTDATGFSSTTL